MKKNCLKRESSAFTLAEVLITLGIIGVVAAMTIPTLMNNIQDMQFKSAWKKEYSTLSQATTQYLQDNSTFLGATNYSNLLSPYLKVVKYCPTHASTEGCWVPSGSDFYLKTAWGYKRAAIPDNSANPDLGAQHGLILADGTTVSTFDVWNASCNLGGACGWIVVDVNGFKAPNTVGRDVFGVWVLKDKITPIGSVLDPVGYIGCGNGDAAAGDSGYGCSAAYLYQ